MKLNITIEIDDEELKELFNLKSEEDYPRNSTRECPDGYSQYARFFNDGCIGWTKNAETNVMFLREQQNYANELLKSKGHLFLNEVYELLGIPRTEAGTIVGWIYNEENPNGDNYVDFGLYNLCNDGQINFINGYNNTVLLDFNVDGNILSLI